MPFVLALLFILWIFSFSAKQGIAFALADYAIQHLPWSYAYFLSLKNGMLPFWTPLIHGGFPLLAEGQVGALYPLRLLLFGLLPFSWAYLLEPILHFYLGWFFTYLYLRHFKLSKTASFLGGIFFIFGSAYAGCFTNTVSMRVVVWFPLSLLLIEKALAFLVENRKAPLLPVSLLALTFYCQWTGGFIQYAVYGQFLVGIHALVRLFLIRDQLRWQGRCIFLFWNFVAFVLGFFLAAPQILPTLELASSSLRLEGAELEFALLGSWFPGGMLSLLLPSLSRVFSPFHLYIGLAPLAAAFLAFRKERSLATYFGIMTLLCMAFALGKFNPLYVWLLKTSHFYGFRLPAKWLAFSAFWLSSLAALGFDSLRKENRQGTPLKMMGLFVFGAALLTWLVSKGEWFRELAHSYVERFVLHRPFHPHPVEVYRTKVESLISQLQLAASPFTNKWLFISFMMAFLLLLGGYFWEKKRISGRVFHVFLILLSLLDLTVFSFYGTGFRGNLGPMQEGGRLPEAQQFLEKVEGRIYNFATEAETYETLLPPNRNMLYGIAAVGAYSPLISQKLVQYLEGLGNVDDSLLLRLSNQEDLEKGLALLSALHVTHIYAKEPLLIESFELEHQSREGYLYRNKKALPRLSLLHKVRSFSDDKAMLAFMKSSKFVPGREILILGKEDVWEEGGTGKILSSRFEDSKIEAEVDMRGRGYLVLADFYYPGWCVTVDGKETPLIPANYLVRAVFLREGRHHVSFEYKPTSFHRGLFFAMLAACVNLILLIIGFGDFKRIKHSQETE